jgi:hypothetical protein
MTVTTPDEEIIATERLDVSHWAVDVTSRELPSAMRAVAVSWKVTLPAGVPVIVSAATFPASLGEVAVLPHAIAPASESAAIAFQTKRRADAEEVVYRVIRPPDIC